jgi:hypothetical protein
MRSIWLRITLGALAVFAVGTTAVHLGRRAKSTVEHALQSDAPLPIPLAGLVPFRMDNSQLGSLRRLEFLRSSPSEISGMRVLVDLADDSTGGALLKCRVALRSIDNIDRAHYFRLPPTRLAGPRRARVVRLIFFGQVRTRFPSSCPTTRWPSSVMPASISAGTAFESVTPVTPSRSVCRRIQCAEWSQGNWSERPSNWRERVRR